MSAIFISLILHYFYTNVLNLEVFLVHLSEVFPLVNVTGALDAFLFHCDILLTLTNGYSKAYLFLFFM